MECRESMPKRWGEYMTNDEMLSAAEREREVVAQATKLLERALSMPVGPEAHDKLIGVAVAAVFDLLRAGAPKVWSEFVGWPLETRPPHMHVLRVSTAARPLYELMARCGAIDATWDGVPVMFEGA